LVNFLILEISLSYIYILGTVLFTVLGQVVIKWRIFQYGRMPSGNSDKLFFILNLLLDPYIILSICSAFTAMLCWMAAMTKFELSHAYPFTGLNFALILLFSSLVFHEPVTIPKVIGVLLIIAGIVVGSQG
jgi:multidrug transporter EmrE-like cation transporter